MKRKILSTICSLFLVGTMVNAQDIDSKLGDAQMAIIDGNYENGLSICKEIISAETSDSTQLADAYAYAGMASEVLKQRSEAIGYYQNAVLYKNPRLDIYDKLIRLSEKEKKYEVYEFALKEQSRVFPDFYKENTKSLANHYAETKQYDKLLIVCDSLLEWTPENINYLYYKAVAFQNLGQNEKANNIYNEILKLDSDHPGANMSIGLLLFNSGSHIFEVRKKEYESIAKPTRSDYHNYNMGIEKGKAQYREALPYLLKAYESGSYPGLKKALYNTYIRLEQKEKAQPYK